MIRFACPDCSRLISVDEKYSGKQGKCPKCKGAVLVPSPEAEAVESAEAASITCSMCGEVIEIPEGSGQESVECPSCGSYIETSPEAVPAVSAGAQGAPPPPTDEDLYEEQSDESEGSAGMDRRLILLISGGAVAVVALIIILAGAAGESGRYRREYDTASA